MMGYIISLQPESFQRHFEIAGNIKSIHIENAEDDGRTDILIITDSQKIVIEAKTQSVNPVKQAKKYDADKIILLTPYTPSNKEESIKNVRYVTWNDVAEWLRVLQGRKDKVTKVFSSDMLQYLEEHGMIKTTDEEYEVYSRDINNDTINQFLKAHLYFCLYTEQKSIYRLKYFAPCFGQKITSIQCGFKPGISYIARIKDIVVVESKPDIIDGLKKHFTKKQIRGFSTVLEHRYRQREKRFMLIMDEPRLLFSPPIPKTNLMGGTGFLGRHYFTFDELFRARSEKIWE